MSPIDPPPARDWLALMRAETRRRAGRVPRELGGIAVNPGQYRLSGDQFLLCAAGEVALLYRKGDGVTIDAPEGTDPREIELFAVGTLYAAIAAINGLLPLHASAVTHRGRVYAFSGPSGAGKSTLAAALVERGFALFCDDTLLLDPASAGPLCLPGHKRLKLWREGLALAGAAEQEEVAPSYPKLFASSSGTEAAEPMPLGALAWLDNGEEIVLEPLTGAERFAALSDDHYTAMLHEWANRMPREERFAFQARLAREIRGWRLTRPFDPARFRDMVDRVSEWIEGQEQE
jgi:hypothetical protein